MDIYSLKTRVSNSQLAGLHVAAAVFLIIGVGAEIAVGNPVNEGGDLSEDFNGALIDPAWIAMQDAPELSLADCLSPALVSQSDGMLHLTALAVESCDVAVATPGSTSNGELTMSSFVQGGFLLPRFGQLRAAIAPPSDNTVEPQVLLVHPDGADVAALTIVGNEVSVRLDGLVRAKTAFPESSANAERVVEADITETDSGVRIVVSIDGQVVLDHAEDVALSWLAQGPSEAAWSLQLALGASDPAALPQTFSLDAISFARHAD